MKNAAWRWIPVIIWMALIFYSSSQSQLPGPPDRAIDFVLKKIAHVAVYAILALLLMRANRLSKQPALYAMIIAALYAASDEMHQSVVPQREATLRDVGIDVFASATALILANRSARAKELLRL